MATESREDPLCYGIIGNIPTNYHSSDLRNYFSQFTESDGFECFHFRHRPEGRRQDLPGNPQLSDYGARPDKIKQKQPMCCVVKLKNSKMKEVLKMYHRRHWLDKNGDSIPALCFISRIKIIDGNKEGPASTYMTRKERCQIPEDRESFTSEHLQSLMELNPPDIMPKGNVGTPTRYFLKLIQECRLPPLVIKKLGLVFPKTRTNRRYGDVPYDYGTSTGKVNDEFEEEVLTASGRKIEKEDPVASGSGMQDNNTDCVASSAAVSNGADVEFKKPNCDMSSRQRNGNSGKMRGKEGKLRKKKPPSFGRPTKQKDISEENVEGIEEDAHNSGSDSDGGEDWDRHDANYDDASNQSRLKERAFEEELEVVWEKGGSGLVFYTDEMVWRQQQGDFDEQTADDWDVDMSGYYDNGAGDKDARDYLDMRRERRLRSGVEETCLANDPAIGKFERYTKGVGRRVLESQGWKEGSGVGRSVEGIADALDTEGQAPTDKRGLGFHGEKINLLSGPANKRSRNPGDVFISTIYDDPKETDPTEPLLRRSELSTLKYRHGFKFVKASDTRSEESTRNIPQTTN